MSMDGRNADPLMFQTSADTSHIPVGRNCRSKFRKTMDGPNAGRRRFGTANIHHITVIGPCVLPARMDTPHIPVDRPCVLPARVDTPRILWMGICGPDCPDGLHR